VKIDSLEIFELFAQEIEKQVHFLHDALFLNKVVDGKYEIKPLVGAAHAIKSACRLVELEPLVVLAHSLEEKLEKPQEEARKNEIFEILNFFSSCSSCEASSILQFIEKEKAKIKKLSEGTSSEGQSSKLTLPPPCSFSEAIRIPSNAYAELARTCKFAENLIDKEDYFYAKEAIQKIEDELVDLRLVTFQEILDGLKKAHESAKEATCIESVLTFTGIRTKVDRLIIGKLYVPISHLIVNAAVHGIESKKERLAKGKEIQGSIKVDISLLEGKLSIIVSDDGRGFSEAKDGQPVTHFSGRGVGIKSAKDAVESLGGTFEVHSKKDVGTRCKILVPITLFVLRALIVEIAGMRFGVPLFEIEKVAANDEKISCRELSLGALKQKPLGPQVIIKDGTSSSLLQCDKVIGPRELVLFDLSPMVGAIDGVSGLAIDDDGTLIYIINPKELQNQSVKKRILLVDKSPSLKVGLELLFSSKVAFDHAEDMLSMWNMMELHHYDLIILNEMQAKSKRATLPDVIFLDDEEEIVRRVRKIYE
jgi:two-component system, chemotaxis family, sensor kinase CheA